MLELLILYILNKYDCTIYKIQKLIEEMFFIFSCPSLGAINPALKRLEGLNCVEFNSIMSEGGKLSKIYKITPFGLKYLKETISLFDFKNPAHLLNNIKVCISLSDVLDEDQKEKFNFKKRKENTIDSLFEIEHFLRNLQNVSKGIRIFKILKK